MKGLLGLLALIAGMTPSARLADEKVRERAQRVDPSTRNHLTYARGYRPFGYKRSGSYRTVNTAQEQARRLRQQAKLEARRAA